MKKIIILIILVVASLVNMPALLLGAAAPSCVCTINGKPNQPPPIGTEFLNNKCTQPLIVSKKGVPSSADFKCQDAPPPPPPVKAPTIGSGTPVAPTCSSTVITPPASIAHQAGWSTTCIPASGTTNPTGLIQISYTAPGTTTVSSAYVPIEYFTGVHNAVKSISEQNGQVVITYDDTKFVKDTNPADDISNLSYRFHNAVTATGCSCTAYRLLSPYNNAVKLGAVIACQCGATPTNIIIPTLKWTNTSPAKVEAVGGQLVASWS